MEKKTCIACKNEYPLNRFGSDPSSRDGHRARCPTCIKASEETRKNVFSRDPRRKAQEMAMVRFLRDHPEIFADIVRRNYEAFKPYVSKMQEELHPEFTLSESA